MMAEQIPDFAMREFMCSLPAGWERPCWEEYREAAAELISALEIAGLLVASLEPVDIGRDKHPLAYTRSIDDVFSAKRNILDKSFRQLARDT
jgi:hypothetical protein